MAASQLREVVQHLRRSVLEQEGAGLTDGQLLGCFVEQRDDAAFAALVQRHGEMVWGVCRRLLEEHDAEDAFQATFLVLVRKAASVVSRERVANWLYGVAHQTALQARRNIARRRAREKQVMELPEPATAEQDLWRDLRPLLDQELSRLPDAYREVILLSDLEGKTRKEVARQLGLPEGTVSSRLARARTMLAKRLTQRGVTSSGGALAAVLSQQVASASVPSSVVDSTIKAASLLAAGKVAAMGAISLEVAALTEGVMKAMLMSKFKAVMVVLLLLAGLGVGLGGLALRMQAAPNRKNTVEEARSEEGAALAPAPPAKEPEGGAPVRGLVGVARAVEKAVGGSTVFEVEFRLKNVSDKPITVCAYLGSQPLEVHWIGPDGKTHKSRHYEWLKTASLAGLTKKAFITIPGGGMQVIRPEIRFVPPTQKPGRSDNVAQFGRHRVTISFTNSEAGKQFGLKEVWTGTVTSNEVTFTVRKDTSKGLKLTLSAEKTETVLKPKGGDAVPVKLKLTFTNLSGKPIKLNAYVLKWRMGFRCVGPGADSVRTLVEYHKLPANYLPAPVAADYPVLQPGTSWAPSWTLPFPGEINEGPAKSVVYTLRKPGTCKLRVILYDKVLTAGEANADKTLWLQSNELELKVREN